MALLFLLCCIRIINHLVFIHVLSDSMPSTFKKNRSTIFPATFWILFIICSGLDVLGGYWFMKNRLLFLSITSTVQAFVLYLLTIVAFFVCWSDIRDENDVDVNNIECDRRMNNNKYGLNKCEIILLRILTLNGIPFWTMIVTILTALRWMYTFEYTFHWGDSFSCVLGLSLLTVVLLIYWSMDTCFIGKYMVWTWTPPLALIFCFAAIIINHHQIGNKHKPALLFTFVLLIATIFFFVVKIFSLCLRNSRQPNPRFSRV